MIHDDRARWKRELQSCHDRIVPWIHRTPVMQSSLINELAQADLFFKCENFQKAGSYKIRGALNACIQLTSEQRERGVVTHSSGNFAAAVALACRQLEIKNWIVIPTSAPEIKVTAATAYGGNIIRCGPTLVDRETAATEIIAEQGASLLHPSNAWDVILGQGTTTKELLEDVADLDVCVCPVGGGGLIAGACLAARTSTSQECQLVGGEPMEADDAYRSLRSGKLESNATTNTIADGLRSQLGDVNFPIILEHVSSIVRISELQLVEAMRIVWTRMKLVIEPSSAVALAAILSNPDLFRGKRVGVVISGGNVDLASLATLFG